MEKEKREDDPDVVDASAGKILETSQENMSLGKKPNEFSLLRLQKMSSLISMQERPVRITKLKGTVDSTSAYMSTNGCVVQ